MESFFKRSGVEQTILKPIKGRSALNVYQYLQSNWNYNSMTLT